MGTILIWIQPIEVYKDKIITYAHGNFVFDQQWSQKTKEGVIEKYTFYDNQPKFLTDQKKKLILDEMKKESEILSTTN